MGKSAAGKPAAVATFAHIGALGTVRQHLAELGTPQPISPPASKALVFDDGRILRFGVLGFDQEPALPGITWPIAGGRLPAVARWQETGCDLAGDRKRSIGRFHNYALYCLYVVTLRQ